METTATLVVGDVQGVVDVVENSDRVELATTDTRAGRSGPPWKGSAEAPAGGMILRKLLRHDASRERSSISVVEETCRFKA